MMMLYLALLFFQPGEPPAAPAELSALQTSLEPATPALTAKEQRSNDAIWQDANQAYQQERFRDARAGYELLQANGVVAPELYFNLGNAYLKNQEIGKAILFYHRALRLSPSDADIRNNLQHATQMRVDPPIEGEAEVFGDAFNRLVWRLDLTTVFYTSFVFLLFAGLASTLLILKPGIGKWAGYLLVVGAVGGLIFAGLNFLQSREQSRQDEAIILSKAADVLAGPSTREAINFTIHEGMRCQIIEEQPGWIRIRLANGFNGWIERNGAERI